MKHQLVATVVALAVGAGFAHAGEIDCEALSAEAAEEAARIEGCTADRVVTGKGRLQFHSAPDQICSMRGVFVIPGDHLIAYSEFGDFTEVMYLNPRTGNDVMGWVQTSRLQETGQGISNCEAG